MLRFDASTAACRIYIEKAGLLAALGHDLEVAVTRFELQIDPAAPSAAGRFDAGSVRVVAALERGLPRPGALSDRDVRDVEERIRKDVLDSARHPAVEFTSTTIDREGAGFRVVGRLLLRGATRTIAFPVRIDGPRHLAEARLHQPDFGIRPYAAPFGALKVKPDVLVRVTLALPG